MIDTIATNIVLRDGIWYSNNRSNISYPDEGNTHCFQIEENSFWFKHRNNCITKTVLKYSPDKVFYDIGGGNGYVSKGLQNHNIEAVLVEPGIKGAINAQKRGLKHVICSTFEDAGFLNEQIDAIGLFDVVEHIEDDYKFLSSINTLMKQNGVVYITVPAYKWLWSNEDVDAGHFRRYTLHSATKLLNKTGFEIIYKSYLFSFLPFPILIFRTIPSLLGFNKKSADVSKHANEHTKSKGVGGKIIDKILDAELKRITKSRVVPFGSSCFLVARKKS